MILPQLNKRTLKLALNIPLLDSRIYAQIRKHLVDALGGRFREVIVGCRHESRSNGFLV